MSSPQSDDDEVEDVEFVSVRHICTSVKGQSFQKHPICFRLLTFRFVFRRAPPDPSWSALTCEATTRTRAVRQQLAQWVVVVFFDERASEPVRLISYLVTCRIIPSECLQFSCSWTMKSPAKKSALSPHWTGWLSGLPWKKRRGLRNAGLSRWGSLGIKLSLILVFNAYTELSTSAAWCFSYLSEYTIMILHIVCERCVCFLDFNQLFSM